MAKVFMWAMCAVLVALLLFSACACLADAGTDYNRGLGLQAQEDYYAAIREFAKVLADSVLGPKACYQTARCYRELANLDEALEACRRGLALATSTEDRDLLTTQLRDLRFAVVQALLEAKDWDGCTARLSELAAEYPEESAWYLAKMLITKGDYADAESALNELLRKYPQSPRAYLYDVYIGKSLLMDDKLGDAFDHLAAVIRKYPDNCERVVFEIRVLMAPFEKADRAEEAKEGHRRMIAAIPADNPAIPGLKFYIAERALREGKFQEASVLLKAIVDEYPSGPWYIPSKFHLAQCYSQLRDYASATELFEEVIAASPDYAHIASRGIARINALKKAEVAR